MRESHVARRLCVARDHRWSDRAGRHHRRWPQGPVRDSGLGHAEGHRPDRVGVRLRAGQRPQPRVRRARGPAARHAGAQSCDREGDRAAQDVRVQTDPGPGGDRERRRPVQQEHALRQRSDRLRRGTVRSRDLHQGSRCGRRGAGRSPKDRRARRRNGGVQRRRRVLRRSSRASRNCSAFSLPSSCS